MGEKISYQLVAIKNSGDVKVGALINLKAKGEVINPVITNVFTGEEIKINKTMSEDEEIIVNTQDDNTRGLYEIQDFEEVSILEYWDYDNTWLMFPVGTSLIGYSADNDISGLLDITVSLNQQMYSLKEQ